MMPTSKTNAFLSWLDVNQTLKSRNLDEGLNLAEVAVTAHLDISPSILPALLRGGYHPFRPEMRHILDANDDSQVMQIMETNSDEVAQLQKGLYRLAMLSCIDKLWMSLKPPFTGSGPIDGPIHSDSEWTRGPFLGQGAFGHVWAYRKGDVMLASKRISTLYGKYNAGKERKILAELHHDHIATFLGSFCDEGEYNSYIYTEYLSGGDLVGLAAAVTLDMADVKALILQALQGLIFLHENKITHMDIKDSNLFISLHGCVKIGDLGCATVIDPDKSLRHPGTAIYASPEMTFSSSYNEKTDIWSMGMVMISLFSSPHPWAHLRSGIVSLNIHHRTTEIPKLLRNIPEIMRPVVQEMLRDEATRPGAEASYHNILRVQC